MGYGKLEWIHHRGTVLYGSKTKHSPPCLVFQGWGKIHGSFKRIQNQAQPILSSIPRMGKDSWFLQVEENGQENLFLGKLETSHP